MKSFLAILLAESCVFGNAATSSPVGKAVELLADLQQKIIKEGDAAQKIYDETTEVCEERSKSLQNSIKNGKAESASLSAAIKEQEAVESSLGTKVEKVSADVATDEGDLKAATAVRGKEHATFKSLQAELVETVDTLRRASRIIEREMNGGGSFVQLKGATNLVESLNALVSASMLEAADAGKIAALLQNDDTDTGAPAGAVYESHSDGILNTLSDLLDKAEDQLDDLRKKETENLHAFQLLQQSLQDEIKFANKDLSETKASIAAAGEKKATAQKDLEMTTKTLNGDESALGDLHHECMSKAEDFEAETKSRADELNALAAAKKALVDNTGGAEDLSYSLDQVSFVQRSRISSSSALKRAEVERLFRTVARKTHSKELALLASQIGMSGDVFGKVKGLIQGMIQKLEKEAEEDATHKAFCDKELSETNAKKDDKTSEIEKLTTRLDKMSSRSAQLKEEVAALNKALSELAAAQAKMDKVRLEEREAFKSNKADMDQGLSGVKTALKVLRDYYAKDDKDHSAAAGSGSSIIGLLEVVESDFTKGLSEMTTTEENSQNIYDEQTKENAVEKTTKSADVKYKTEECTRLDNAVAETTSDRASVQTELDAVNEYLKGIEAQCIAKAETFEERQARFEAELAGLKEGLRVLSEETSFIQEGVRQLRGVKHHRE